MNKQFVTDEELQEQLEYLRQQLNNKANDYLMIDKVEKQFQKKFHDLEMILDRIPKYEEKLIT